MPEKKAYFRKPGHSTRFVPVRMAKKDGGVGRHRALPVESIFVDEGVWDSVKKGEAEALKKLANLVSEAGEDSGQKRLGWRLVVRMDRERRIPKFEIEDAGPEPASADDLQAALAEARERGRRRELEGEK